MSASSWDFLETACYQRAAGEVKPKEGMQTCPIYKKQSADEMEGAGGRDPEGERMKG